MKKIVQEFKAFISRGNVMDMAVGILIGGAFTGIVTSLVEDIINPILGLFGGMNFDQFALTLSGDAALRYGKFLTAVFHFLLMALIVFLIVKLVNRVSEQIAPKQPEVKKTKTCPFCISEIPLEAVRCPHCTSVLETQETDAP